MARSPSRQAPDPVIDGFYQKVTQPSPRAASDRTRRPDDNGPRLINPTGFLDHGATIGRGSTRSGLRRLGMDPRRADRDLLSTHTGLRALAEDSHELP